MKKIYINPNIDVVNIKAPAILSGSPQPTETPASQNGDGDYNDARYGDYDWDEEEY